MHVCVCIECMTSSYINFVLLIYGFLVFFFQLRDPLECGSSSKGTRKVSGADIGTNWTQVGG